jgi:hypothetical protein
VNNSNMRKLITISLCVGTVALGGCASGTVSAVNIKPAVDKVVSEHAAYVAADENLSADLKEIKTRTGAWLKQAVDEAATPVEVVP